MLTIRHLTEGKVLELDPSALEEAVASGDGVVWLDMTGEGEPEMQALCSLGIDEWVAEDVLQTSTRPKAEVHPDYLFLVVHAVDLDEADERFELDTMEIDAVVGPNWLVTHTLEPLPLIRLVTVLVETDPEAAKSAGDLLHLMLDTLVDEYEPFVDDFIPERIDAIETALFEDLPGDVVRREIQLRRRDVLRLARVARPQAAAVEQAAQRTTVLDPRMHALLADIADRLHHVAGQTESLRAQLDTAFDHYQSVVANRQNEIMKVLTMVSATLLPMTVVTGIYGMNFEFMPELDERWGYPWALGLSAFIVVVNLTFFYMRGWIGRRRSHVAGRILNVGARALRTPAIGARVVTRNAARLAPFRALRYPRQQPPR